MSAAVIMLLKHPTRKYLRTYRGQETRCASQQLWSIHSALLKFVSGRVADSSFKCRVVIETRQCVQSFTHAWNLVSAQGMVAEVRVRMGLSLVRV